MNRPQMKPTDPAARCPHGLTRADGGCFETCNCGHPCDLHAGGICMKDDCDCLKFVDYGCLDMEDR